MKTNNWSRVILVWAFAAGSAGAANANTSAFESLPREHGIWRRRVAPNSLSTIHEERLIERLRLITGLAELQFMPDGSLSTGIKSNLRGGAQTARNILLQALNSKAIFVIEDHSGSESVHFGQLESFLFKRTEPPIEVEIYRIRLDFKDFREMEASKPVRETFDEGFTLLHELLHGLGYEDLYSQTEVGPCEEIVNRARAELGLPLREQYLADAIPVTDRFTTLRLQFRDGPSPRGKARSHYLYFIVNDSLAALTALSENARTIRARQRANPDRRVSVKVSLAPPHAGPALNSARE